MQEREELRALKKDVKRGKNKEKSMSMEKKKNNRKVKKEKKYENERIRREREKRSGKKDMRGMNQVKEKIKV
jgi:hypothetical protein